MVAPNQLSVHEDAAKWKRILDNAIRILVLLSAVALCFSLYFTLVSLNRIEEIGEANNRLNKIMLDCTQPKGECYERSVATTAQAVVELSDVSKAATVCADKPGSLRIEEMDACIKTELAKIK